MIITHTRILDSDKGRHQKKQTAKVRTLSQQGEGGLGRMADVRTSLVGENDIAGRKKSLLGEKSHCWEKNVWCSQ